MTPLEAAQLTFEKLRTQSAAFLLKQYHIGLEKQGVSSGFLMQRYTQLKKPTALAAIGRFEVALASMVGDELRNNSSVSFQTIVNNLKQVSANVNRAPVDHSHLTPTFDGAITGEDYVSLAAFQKLKATEVSFEEALLEKSRTTVPDLTSKVHEVFAAQQQEMHDTAKEVGLRVLFDEKTGAVHYAHDQARVDQIMGAARSNSPDKSNASIRVMTFTASANANSAPQTQALDLPRAELPAPRPRGMAA